MFLDKIAYERIINNLFQNIVVHSDADKMKLDMEILDEKVCIDITDWGTGIEEGNFRLFLKDYISVTKQGLWREMDWGWL